MKKKASLITPFALPEKLLIEKFVKRFTEETYQLLKVYEGKVNLKK